MDVARDGHEGLACAEAGEHAVVLLDVMLPGLDGFQIVEALRRGGKRVPVLMLTAREDVDDRVRGLRAGADDYLVKPFAFFPSCWRAWKPCCAAPRAKPWRRRGSTWPT